MRKYQRRCDIVIAEKVGNIDQGETFHKWQVEKSDEGFMYVPVPTSCGLFPAMMNDYVVALPNGRYEVRSQETFERDYEQYNPVVRSNDICSTECIGDSVYVWGVVSPLNIEEFLKSVEQQMFYFRPATGTDKDYRKIGRYEFPIQAIIDCASTYFVISKTPLMPLKFQKKLENDDFMIFLGQKRIDKLKPYYEYMLLMEFTAK